MRFHLSYVLVGLFVAAMFYRRIRLNLGFQPVVPLRLWLRSALFAAFCALILLVGAAHPWDRAADLGGAVCGCGLGLFAMRAVALQRRADAWYYRPHPWIGSALSALFVWGLANKVWALYASGRLAGSGALALLVPHFDLQAYAQDLWTAAEYFLLAAYSVTSSLCVLRAVWRAGAATADRRPAAAGGAASAPGLTRPSPEHS